MAFLPSEENHKPTGAWTSEEKGKKRNQIEGSKRILRAQNERKKSGSLLGHQSLGQFLTASYGSLFRRCQ